MPQALSTSLPLNIIGSQHGQVVAETNWMGYVPDHKEVIRNSGKRTGWAKRLIQLGLILRILKRFIRGDHDAIYEFA
jgi:hypothetical protein